MLKKINTNKFVSCDEFLIEIILPETFIYERDRSEMLNNLVGGNNMEFNKMTLLEQVTLLLNDIQINSPEKGSHEWYVTNNLNSFYQAITTATAGKEVKIAAKILSRYCVESMHWDSELFKRCSNITESARRLAKKFDQQVDESLKLISIKKTV